MDRRFSNSSSVTITKRNVSRNRHISSKGIRQQSVLKRQFPEKSVKMSENDKITENDQITEYDKLPDAECDKMSAESQSEDSIPEETRESTQGTQNSDQSIMVRWIDIILKPPFHQVIVIGTRGQDTYLLFSCKL